MTLFLFTITTLLFLGGAQTTCHYSCQSCVGEYYTLCVNCTGSDTMEIVEDPSLIPEQYRNSNVQTGVCTGHVPTSVNPLGIIMVVFMVAMVLIIRTKQSLFVLYTLQTFALVSFVELAWLSPSNYVLQSLQYFMVFNLIGSVYKTPDYTLTQEQYYRLHEYLNTSDFLSNVAIIGLIDVVVFLLMLIFFIQKHRNHDEGEKKQLQSHHIRVQQIHTIENLNETPPQNSNPSQISHSQSSSRNIEPTEEDTQPFSTIALRILQTIFFLLIQETILIIFVALRFHSRTQPVIIACSILYLLMVLTFLVSMFWETVWFFPNKPTQYVCWWRKIVLPLMVIVPIGYQYLLIVFLLVFVFVEGFFDFRGGDFTFCSRITLYKLLQLVVIAMIGIYYIIQRNNNQESASSIMAIFVTIGILAFMACGFLELVLGIKETYCNNQVHNSAEVKNVEKTSNQDAFGHNFATDDEENTEQRNCREEEERRKRELEEQRARLQQEEEERREEQRIREEERKRIEKERLKRQEEERLKKQEERKRLQQQRLRKEEQKRKKREQQEAKRKAEAQRRRKQEQQRQRKEEQQRQRLEEERRIEEEERMKKQEQQRKRKEQEDRIFKQEQQKIHQQEQEQRQRRKKKYKGQMDSELRRRYGF